MQPSEQGIAMPVSGPVLMLHTDDVEVAIRHWLVFTFFALFYGVLKWVYRKRGKAVADE
jgi:hypothetical protein